MSGAILVAERAHAGLVEAKANKEHVELPSWLVGCMQNIVCIRRHRRCTGKIWRELRRSSHRHGGCSIRNASFVEGLSRSKISSDMRIRFHIERNSIYAMRDML